MGITEDVYLPTDEELKVQEINVSTSVLRAGAFHLGKACEFENNVRLELPNHCHFLTQNIYRSLCYAERS